MLGKVLGAMIGAGLGMALAWSGWLAGLLGVLGAFAGHFALDRPASKSAPPVTRAPAPKRPSATVAGNDRETNIDLLKALCPLFIELARVDGPPVRAEIRAIREYFECDLSFDQECMSAVRGALKAALAVPSGNVERLTHRARLQLSPSMRLGVVRALYAVGLVDGDLQRSELELMRQIVGILNLGDAQLLAITTQFFGGGQEAYTTLGLSPSASDDELKSAYRQLATEHHPDRTSDGGAKFRQVKDAYEAIKRLRGL